jgi:hypothetical protein
MKIIMGAPGLADNEPFVIHAQGLSKAYKGVSVLLPGRSSHE